MFGINEVSWPEFLKALCCLLVGWYVLVMILAWIKTQNKPVVHYEDKQQDDHIHTGGIRPLAVSAKNFPDRVLSPLGANSIPLEVSEYEEAWPEDGYQLEYLLEEKEGKLLKQLLPSIQYQQ